jgi:hypothetical protein
MLMSMCILDSCHVVGKQEGADLRRRIILGYWWFPHGSGGGVLVYIMYDFLESYSSTRRSNSHTTH